MIEQDKEWVDYNEMLADVGTVCKHNGKGERNGRTGKIVRFEGDKVVVYWKNLGESAYTSKWCERHLLLEDAPATGERTPSKPQWVIIGTHNVHISSTFPVFTDSDEADRQLAYLANRNPGKVYYKAQLVKKAVTQSLQITDL